MGLAAAAVVGLLGGVAATVAVVAATSGGDEDLDLACAAVEEIDVESAFEDGLGPDLYRIIGAGALISAAADGDPDSRLGRLGAELNRGPQTLDEDATEAAVDDAEDYCDAR